MFDNINKLAMNSKAGVPTEGDVPGWVIEPKYDGIRLLFHITEDGVSAYARSGNSKTGKLPAIEAELFANLPAGTWIDGEAVDFNDDGTQNWGGAQSVLGSGVKKAAMRSGTIRFVVFDVLALDGTDVRGMSLSDRRELLDYTFEVKDFENVILSPQQPASSDLHDKNLELGFEGSMVKKLTGTYESGKRSGNSLKWKATDTEDCVVTGVAAADPDSWIAAAGLIGSLTFVHYENGEEIHGKCSGMTVAERKIFTKASKEGTLVGAVIEVSYMTRMPGSGKLRHPNFQRIRTDKTPEECKS